MEPSKPSAAATLAEAILCLENAGAELVAFLDGHEGEDKPPLFRAEILLLVAFSDLAANLNALATRAALVHQRSFLERIRYTETECAGRA